MEFKVPATSFPFFHPVDSPTLTDVIGRQKCKSYSVFEDRSGSWTITSLPLRVKPNSTLQLRSLDVTICPELHTNHNQTSPSKKRTLSVTSANTLSSSQSPSKRAAVGSPRHRIDIQDEYRSFLSHCYCSLTLASDRRDDSDDDQRPPPSSSPIPFPSDEEDRLVI